jgi:hypothetical protein
VLICCLIYDCIGHTYTHIVSKDNLDDSTALSAQQRHLNTHVCGIVKTIYSHTMITGLALADVTYDCDTSQRQLPTV